MDDLKILLGAVLAFMILEYGYGFIIGRKPINMLLRCPVCHWQHIDAPEPAAGWTNPPHKTHLCHNPACRHIWKPANVPTNGVAEL